MVPRLFDTDQHVTPPPDMWTSRMPKKYADVAPRVVDLPDGGQAWSFDGGAYLHLFGMQNVEGKDPATFKWRATYDEIGPACYDPQARLTSMDIDGVDVTLLFPSGAEYAASVQDEDLCRESLRAYNDGIWDWAQQGDPKRMYPAALIPCVGVETAMAELHRVAKLGFRHFLGIVSPSGNGYPAPEDDPFWSLAQETGLAMSMHGGGPGRVKRSAGTPEPPKHEIGKPRAPLPRIPASATRASGLGAPMTLGILVMTGVLERFPGLRIGMNETGAAWLPSFCERLDEAYIHHRWLGEQRLRLLPSEYIKRQVKASIDRELQGIKHRDAIGVDNLMFGTDYPHMGSFYPHSRRTIDLLFDSVPDDETHKILWENAAALYGVE